MAIRSTTYIEAKTPEGEEGEEAPRFPKTVYLFYRLQVEKAENK